MAYPIGAVLADSGEDPCCCNDCSEYVANDTLTLTISGVNNPPSCFEFFLGMSVYAELNFSINDAFILTESSPGSAFFTYTIPDGVTQYTWNNSTCSGSPASTTLHDVVFNVTCGEGGVTITVTAGSLFPYQCVFLSNGSSEGAATGLPNNCAAWNGGTGTVSFPP